MIAAPPHYGDELQDYVDKRLNANVRRAVEDHLNVCAECRRQIDALTWTKQAIRMTPTTRAPRHLREEILRELRTEKVEVELLSKNPRSWGSNLPIVIAIAVLIGLGAVIVNEYRSRPVTVPTTVARDFQELRANDLNLSLETTNPNVLSAYFEGFEVPFPVRIFDPQEMGATLVGGRVLDPDGQVRMLALYRGASGQLIACETFNGREAGLPAGATIREIGGVSFHVYREGGISSVFWREGPVMCSLASDMDSEQVVQLAASQAKS
ncbi:MAG TPA: anti-sigma factor [Opitutaceae bacterium]|nr:anti-sigma factor [Opitutaceae bacterium]